ncbi:MAG: Cna B-type domain-containing protein, partial [Clostridia bacterium]|nr:Cna B-type domain-containing protein [Clostridia bacterium]
FSVTKEWQGGEGGPITLTLYQNGEKMNPQPAYSESNNVYTYENLPQYTKEGKAIVYAAKEKYMDGFMTIYRNIAPYAQETDMIYNGGTIVNRAVTTFRVQKVWEGLSEGEEAPEITLTLYCNGEVMDKKTPNPDANGWYIYHNLPLTRNGEAAVYTVVEEPLDGFQASYGEAAEGEEAPACAYDYGTIVNRKIPKTDDNSHIGLWIGLTVLSAGMLAMLWKKRKKA